jgi:hypothetical protein
MEAGADEPGQVLDPGIGRGDSENMVCGDERWTLASPAPR